MKPDYLIVGSGLSALVFGALMANSGKTVQILEAHEHPGGFGHTFTMAKKYTFNAQFHFNNQGIGSVKMTNQHSQHSTKESND